VLKIEASSHIYPIFYANWPQGRTEDNQDATHHQKQINKNGSSGFGVGKPGELKAPEGM